MSIKTDMDRDTDMDMDIVGSSSFRHMGLFTTW
jgi:hypothetical protein